MITTTFLSRLRLRARTYALRVDTVDRVIADRTTLRRQLEAERARTDQAIETMLASRENAATELARRVGVEQAAQRDRERCDAALDLVDELLEAFREAVPGAQLVASASRTVVDAWQVRSAGLRDGWRPGVRA